MNELINIGISINDLKTMLEINPSIKALNDKDIKENIEILRLFDLDEKEIKHILISNPLYLSRSVDDIKDLLKKLSELGFDDFNLIFDTNPYLLNNDSYEIDEYIEENMKKGLSIKEILEKFESNFYMLEEE